ncbi:Ankyrin repeat domain-containing protein 33B [Anthophora retusa]
MILSDELTDPNSSTSTSFKIKPKPKARRILEDSWQVNGVETARVKCNSSVKDNTCTVVNNYSIVASRGELARNNCAVKETPALCIANKKSKALVNASSRTKHRDKFLEEKQLPKEVAGSTDFTRTLRPIRKSLSVPNYFGEDPPTAQKSSGRRAAEESILKRSSAFLASLTHSANRIREKRVNGQKQGESSTNDYRTESKFNPSTFRGYFSILSSVNNDLEPLRRSPSVQTLPAERKQKSGARVKKSVSFSSDTSFEEKRAPFRRAAVHEVKVYHKGVLQDPSAREASIVRKVPSSWEATSEGRSALLRAARDADDAALNKIAAQLRKFGFGDIDVNMADSSGRTAMSYMAGNGASTVLEMALSFEGVDPNIPDNEGNTPLHFAAQAGQTECLNILLQNCPDIEVDARNASGFTPLMKAALQGRTKCAKILLFAGANPTLRDHGRGLRAEQWARFCGRYVCAEVIERFARHRLLERSTSCRWGSEPELAAKVLQGKLIPVPNTPLLPSSSGFKSKIRKVFRTTSGPDRNFSLVSQLTSAALCASSPALPKSSEVPPVVKSLLRPLSVPQLRVTLVSPQDFLEQSNDKYGSNFTEKIESTATKPSRSKKKSK